MQNRMLKSCIFTPKPLRKKESLGPVSIYTAFVWTDSFFKKSKIIEQQSQQNGIYTPQLVPSIKSVRTRWFDFLTYSAM